MVLRMHSDSGRRPQHRLKYGRSAMDRGDYIRDRILACVDWIVNFGGSPRHIYLFEWASDGDLIASVDGDSVCVLNDARVFDEVIPWDDAPTASFAGDPHTYDGESHAVSINWPPLYYHFTTAAPSCSVNLCGCNLALIEPQCASTQRPTGGLWWNSGF